MFSSKKETPPPPPNNVPAAKRAARSSAPSIISADLVVNGTLTSTGDIQIDGRVEGDVRSAGLVIGDKAFIHGEIFAEEVTVRGRVQGSIRARKVLLCSTSHVEGNILHEAFAVETGAFFEGNCRHADNPLAEDAGKKTTEFKAAPVGSASSSAPSAVSAMVSRPMTSTPVPAGAAAALKS
jgi:cytoskeletal protein CcmA (bactofilin family)